MRVAAYMKARSATKRNPKFGSQKFTLLRMAPVGVVPRLFFDADDYKKELPARSRLKEWMEEDSTNTILLWDLSDLGVQYPFLVDFFTVVRATDTTILAYHKRFENRRSHPSAFWTEERIVELWEGSAAKQASRALRRNTHDNIVIHQKPTGPPGREPIHHKKPLDLTPALVSLSPTRTVDGKRIRSAYSLESFALLRFRLDGVVIYGCGIGVDGLRAHGRLSDSPVLLSIPEALAWLGYQVKINAYRVGQMFRGHTITQGETCAACENPNRYGGKAKSRFLRAITIAQMEGQEPLMEDQREDVPLLARLLDTLSRDYGLSFQEVATKPRLGGVSHVRIAVCWTLQRAKWTRSEIASLLNTAEVTVMSYLTRAQKLEDQLQAWFTQQEKALGPLNRESLPPAENP